MTVPTTLPAYAWSELAAKLGLSPVAPTRRSGGRARASVEPDIAAMLTKPCRDGERTTHLTSLIGKMLAAGYAPGTALTKCRAWNRQNIDVLDDDKVKSTFDSILTSDQRNHPERYPPPLSTTPLFPLAQGRIDRYLHSKPAPRRWLLRDTIVLGKTGAIVAPGGSSKSQWLLQLAVGVASGIPVADHWQIGEQGSVLMFCAEDDAEEIHRRLQCILDQLKFACHQNDLQGIEDRLYVFPTIGHDTLLTRRTASGEVEKTPTVDQIAAMAEQLDDLKLIVIDPASRFRGGEENSNEDATRFVEALETLAQGTGATVLIAHHTNKGSYSPDVAAGQGASRGASALTDGLRWQMNLGPVPDKKLREMHLPPGPGQHVLATVTKSNYAAFPEPVVLERLNGGYLSAVNAQAMQARQELASIAKLLRAILGEPKPLTARAIERRFGGQQGDLGLAIHTLRELVRKAQARGFLSGAQRKPLMVTMEGHLMLQASPATELATPRPAAKPRAKRL